jgi:hypothetical protein
MQVDIRILKSNQQKQPESVDQAQNWTASPGTAEP